MTKRIELHIYYVLDFIVILFLFSCNNDITKNHSDEGMKEKVNKEIELINEYSLFIINDSPNFYNRNNSFKINDTLYDDINLFLKDVCPKTKQSENFLDFCKIFILNEYYLDIICCRQTYDLKEKLIGNYSIILKMLADKYDINIDSLEIFTSGLALDYIISDSNNSKEVNIMINKIKNISKMNK